VVSSKASYEFTTGLYVQKVNLSSTGSDDPVMTPAVPISLTNYPNPFRDQTQICVKLEDATPVTLKIYNIRGQLVRTIRQEEAIRGDNYLIWDGRDSNNHSCATGVYYLKAETASSNATLRTLRIK
jgi:flagellar hook assembly protein FlgD